MKLGEAELVHGIVLILTTLTEISKNYSLWPWIKISINIIKISQEVTRVKSHKRLCFLISNLFTNL